MRCPRKNAVILTLGEKGSGWFHETEICPILSVSEI